MWLEASVFFTNIVEYVVSPFLLCGSIFDKPAACGADIGVMSLEDVISIASLGAGSGSSDHCNSQGQDQDPENQSLGQDGIFLERIASLSVDMFDPSDFTGRFTKIQSKSRKRTRIIRGRYQGDWDPLFLRSSFVTQPGGFSGQDGRKAESWNSDPQVSPLECGLGFFQHGIWKIVISAAIWGMDLTSVFIVAFVNPLKSDTFCVLSKRHKITSVIYFLQHRLKLVSVRLDRFFFHKQLTLLELTWNFVNLQPKTLPVVGDLSDLI